MGPARHWADGLRAPSLSARRSLTSRFARVREPLHLSIEEVVGEAPNQQGLQVVNHTFVDFVDANERGKVAYRKLGWPRLA